MRNAFKIRFPLVPLEIVVVRSANQRFLVHKSFEDEANV